ncbi:EamA family transporter [Vandammella animalimorsus]|uniref:EamA family transporter n=2 Tax=Vandammella animalimorsus TaxID=2029117 RepID=A0A2A2ATJ5_9BURK|nr:EamA family transporter [Vandammella animalimorsus]
MAMIWGASWPWGRIVALNMPPLAAAAARFLLASALLLVWMGRSGRLRALRSLSPRQWLGLALAAATGVFGYAVFFMLALQSVPSSRAVLAIALNPVATLLLAALVFKERLNGAIALGMLLAVGGALLAIGNGAPAPSQLPAAGDAGLGEWLLLGCVLCWAAYTLIGRAVLTRVDALSATGVSSVLGALLLALLSLGVEGPSAWRAMAQAPAAAWWSLLALSFGAAALAYAWYYAGVKALGAGAASGYITLVPVFGVLCSSLWLGEPLGATLLLGGLLAIGGMALMHWGRLRA